MAATAQGILEKAREFRAHALDVVEWRVDFYEDVFQLPKVLSTLKGLREILGETPILFTFRTRKEGARRRSTWSLYGAEHRGGQSGDADAVDVEVFSGDEVVRRPAGSHRPGLQDHEPGGHLSGGDAASFYVGQSAR